MRRSEHERIVNDLRREHREERRQWADERERLLDRIMLLADKPLLADFQPTTVAPLVNEDFVVDAYPDILPD